MTRLAGVVIAVVDTVAAHGVRAYLRACDRINTRRFKGI